MSDLEEMWANFRYAVASKTAYVLTDTPFNELLLVAVLVYGTVRAIIDGLSLAPGSASVQVRDLLWFSILCGLSSFAAIEILKRLFNLRGAFHARATCEWLNHRFELTISLRHDMPEWVVEHRPFEDLKHALGVAYARDWRNIERFFGLPVENLTAQVAAAADITSVSQYPALVVALAGDVDGAFERLRERSVYMKPYKQEADDEFELARKIRSGVDQLQISLNERWRRNVQLAAVWISGAMGVALTFAADVSAGSHARYVLTATLLGGVIAWYVRDVCATVERLRRP